jgi:hypothetical protein
MPRKKQQTSETTRAEAMIARAQVQPGNSDGAAIVDVQGLGPAELHPKNWGPPYKTILVCKEKGFEMGEDRRFKHRVFKFKETPSDQVLVALKENGFIYWANEKAWAISANADTRRLSDELALEFAGHASVMSR